MHNIQQKHVACSNTIFTWNLRSRVGYVVYNGNVFVFAICGRAASEKEILSANMVCCFHSINNYIFRRAYVLQKVTMNVWSQAANRKPWYVRISVKQI